MKTVLLAIPNYVFMSDILRTKYIEYLASKYQVVVLTPFVDELVASEQNYFISPNVIYKKWDLQSPRFWGIMKTLRISMVNEFDYLPSLKYWYLRPNYKNSFIRKFLRFFALPFKKLLTADFFTGLEKWLTPKSVAFGNILKEHRPSLLVTPTPGFDSLEAELILFAKRAGLPTVAMNFTWDNLTMNAKHIRKTDYLIAWNGVMKREAESIHRYSSDKIFVSGTPRFDPYFACRCGKHNPNNANQNPNYPNRSYHSDSFSEHSDYPCEPSREEFLKSKGLNSRHQTIFHTTVTKAYPFQKKYIYDLIRLRDEKKIPYVNLFIRIHPLDLPENYKEFSGVPDLAIEKAGGGGKEGKVEMNYQDLLNLKYSLKYTDLNINYASTISIEACIFDKPIINIGYIDRFALAYEFNHYKPIVESGAVRVSKTEEDLAKFINVYLKNPELDREGREKIVRDYVEFTDGLSYKRSVDFLEEIISSHV